MARDKIRHSNYENRQMTVVLWRYFSGNEEFCRISKFILKNENRLTYIFDRGIITLTQ
ncbi:hypothetical protein J2S25_000821 [Mesobacillus stamsii]|uniref:Uncharacterized protein n=1 Tax=Mesobacillus stamsii TaxID=225347 RepID=A0ABU0FRW5_9BACI|nr:hypothetical protein [Mesobacillus stamsii]